MSNATLKKGLLFILFFYILLLGILNIQLDHYNFEGGLYKYRFESITQDHDFNLINNTYGHFNDVITPTDNIADMHDVGAPIIWSFFYDWYHTFFPELKPLKLKDTAYILDDELIPSTLQLLLLFLLFYLLFQQNIISKDQWPLPFLLAFSLGVQDYTIDQFFNADILALFVMGILIIHISKIDLQNKFDVYTMSLLFGVLRVIKISSILYAPALIIFLYLKRHSLNEFLQNIFRFGITYLIFIGLTEINFYTNLGSWSFLQGYSYPYSLDSLVNLNGWLASYFYPRGLFLHTPILLFSLIPLALLAKKMIKTSNFRSISQKELITFLICSFMLIKLALGLVSISNQFMGPGARQFFIDFVPLCILFQFLWLRSKKLTIFFLIDSCLALIFYTFIWYGTQKDFELFTLQYPNELQLWWNSFSFFLSQTIPYFKRYLVSLIYNWDLLILIGFFSVILFIFFTYYKNKSTRFYTSIILAFIIVSYSLINLYQNDRETNKYFKDHDYANYIQSKGGLLYMHHEIISGLSLAKEYERRYGNPSSQKYIDDISKKIKYDINKDISLIGAKFKGSYLKSDYLENESLSVDSLKINQNK